MKTGKKDKILLDALREYIERCNNEKEAKEKKEKGHIPNLCGYCGYVGIGRSELAGKLSGREELADRIATALEDAAINADPSSGVLNLCIRMTEDLRENKKDDGITVVFLHPDGEEERISREGE